jgi:hypothetical protein
VAGTSQKHQRPHTQTQWQTHSGALARAHTHIHTQWYTHVHTHKHTHKHKHKHTYTHTQTLTLIGRTDQPGWVVFGLNSLELQRNCAPKLGSLASGDYDYAVDASGPR